MERSAFEARLKQEGFLDVSEAALPAGESRGEHAHHFDVLALVLDGAITLTWAGAARSYGAGEYFTMKAGVMHAEDVGSAGVRY
ncbi:MAG: cupin domain-containing protein, partial [Alphaproteobacteria bacterium]|nr:cupin domain-containing protein [Alphaproteobacteria bacterium]